MWLRDRSSRRKAARGGVTLTNSFTPRPAHQSENRQAAL